MSSIPAAPPTGTAALDVGTGSGAGGILLRLGTGLRRGLAVRPRPFRQRMRVLALLGLLLTLFVGGTAWVSLADVGAVNRELGEVSRAQRFHQDADMMHDALRADVARAQHAAGGGAGVDADVIRDDARRHAAQFRSDLAAIRTLRLPPDLSRALNGLRPAQRAYIAGAERMVASALLGRGAAEVALSRYEEAFQRLVPTQAAVTERLAATSARTASAAAAQEQLARRMVVLSSLTALTGWLGLVVWLSRSVGSLRAALVREAEQRSAAELLQSSLLPTRLPEVPGVGLAARSIPGRSGLRVGGDWYDVIPLPTGEIGLVVGDVVGHDLPAATAMGQLRNALRAYALDETSPGAVLSRVNRAALLLDVADMATCLYAVLDPSTLTVRWSSAGHLLPMVSSGRRPGRLLCGEPGPPLGVTTEAVYGDHDLRLDPGEALVLYSDGLVERRGASIDCGLADLAAVTGPHPSPDAMCDRLLSAALGDSAPCDDVTLLLVQTSLDQARRLTA